MMLKYNHQKQINIYIYIYIYIYILTQSKFYRTCIEGFL